MSFRDTSKFISSVDDKEDSNLAFIFMPSWISKNENFPSLNIEDGK